MALLANAIRNTADVADTIPAPVALVMGVPMLAVVGREVVSQLSFLGGMKPAQAVAVYGIVGGLSGLAANVAAGNNISQLSRPIHIIEVLPAVFATTAGAWIMTHYLLPPVQGATHEFVQQVTKA